MINLDAAAGTITLNNGEILRNPGARYSDDIRADIEECKNKIREVLGCIDEDQVMFLSSASEGISMAINQKDSWLADGGNHSVVFESGRLTENKKEAEGYIVSYANSETGIIRYDREYMHTMKEEGKLTILDISQNIKKKLFSFSVEKDVDICIFSTSKIGARGGILIARPNINLNPLIYGHYENNKRGGTPDYNHIKKITDCMINYEIIDYSELWYTAYYKFKDLESVKHIVKDEPHLMSTICIELYGETEILAESLKDKIYFSTGSTCNNGMFNEPYKETFGITGGIIRLSFEPSTTIDMVNEACDIIINKMIELGY